MARIALPAGDGLEVGRALTLAPHFAEVVIGYEKAVARTSLDPRLHELVRFRIAQLNQCTVCLGYRRPDAEVTEELLAQVDSWRASTELSDTEKAALDFTEQFSRDSAAISDDLLAELETRLGTSGLVDLTLVVGKYLVMGRFMQVLGLDQACVIDPERVAAL
jgi:alkylhydroperoxidase family enzyme